MLPMLLLASGEFMAADFFVAPDGSASRGWLAGAPWDLQTALSHPAIVQPGDNIWLRQGVYRGTFTSKLKGAPGRPIIVPQLPGERATLDYPGQPEELQVLRIDGAWTWYWGLEVISSWPVRIDPPKQRATGVNVYGPHVKLINLVIHDTFGTGFWSGSDDSEMYGNIVYNNGEDRGDRGHGHGIYGQNREGSKLITDNIVFQNFSHGLHVFGSDERLFEQLQARGQRRLQQRCAFPVRRGAQYPAGRRRDRHQSGADLRTSPTGPRPLHWGRTTSATWPVATN